jgi:hypothetical protein
VSFERMACIISWDARGRKQSSPTLRYYPTINARTWKELILWHVTYSQ